jgi:hypothetical protein
MRRLLVLLALLALPTSAGAQVAFDKIDFSSGAGSVDPLEWTHTPVGTPRAVIVQITQTGGTGADQVVSVTYGGAAMTEVATCSPNRKTASESWATYTYFLGSSIPTGAQTVSVDVSATGAKRGSSITLTATTDTEVVDCDGTINSDSVTDPSVTLSLGGRTSFVALAAGSGEDDPASTAPLTNWTDHEEADHGVLLSLRYTYDIISTADVTAGWTQTTDDAVAIAIAVSEVVAGGSTACRNLLLLGVGGACS